MPHLRPLHGLVTALAMAAAGCPAEPSSPTGEPEGDVGKGDLWHQNQLVRLPFEAGTTVVLSQTFHGHLSHNGTQGYAIDFPADVGTVVVAARSGRVIATRADSNHGCGDASCADQANYVVVDHGDGTIGRYWHLQQGGVDVAVGDMVCRGQPLGRSGNTGFSTGPHLHFAITNVHGETIPVLFTEFAEAQLAEMPDPVPGRRIHGAPFPGAEVVSENVPVACEPVEPSTCDDAFIHFGVRILSDIPCSGAQLDKEYLLSGVVFGDSDRILVGQMKADGWANTCVEVEREPGAVHGRFSTALTWPRSDHDQFRSTYLMVLGARANSDGSCSWDWGWSQSAHIYLSD